jgi:hypothetical protein
MVNKTLDFGHAYVHNFSIAVRDEWKRAKRVDPEITEAAVR